MDFRGYLSKVGMQGILDKVEYKHPKYQQEEKIFSFLDDIVQNQRSVLVYGDYDVDGLMCALGMKDALALLGVEDFSVYKYKNRTHALDRSAVKQCYQENYEYMIICDTGSGYDDMDSIEYLAQNNVKIILLDHHETLFEYSDYPENVAVVNTTVENRALDEDVYKLSAGALCFTVMYKYICERTEYNFLPQISYALVSLYSDCMDMGNEFNRSIYWKAKDLASYEMPNYIRHFMSNDMKFTRRFIEYQFAPRINALFRSENFGLLNSYFFPSKEELPYISNYITEIIKLHELNRKFVNELTDALLINDTMNSFVVCNLTDHIDHDIIEKHKVHNYTGLIAQKLSERFNKTGLVICKSADGYKGSVRDLYGRNYLNVFRQICEAGGHNAAFGMKINLFDLDDFFERVKKIDEFYQDKNIQNRPIVIAHTKQKPDTGLIVDMALYNDFSGQTLPIAYLSKVFAGISQRQTSYGFYYSWDGVVITASTEVSLGSEMILKPYNGNKVKLQLV